MIGVAGWRGVWSGEGGDKVMGSGVGSSPGPSWRALMQAYSLAAHQFESEVVYADPLTVRLLGVDARILGGPILGATESSPQELKAIRIFGASMRQYADEVVVDSVARGLGQLVVLDAGLDTTCYRRDYPQTALFECDDAATLEWKTQRMTDVGLPRPRSVRYLSVPDQDLAQVDFEAAGYDYDKDTLVMWIGSLPLSPESALYTVMDWLDRHQGRIEFLFDYLQLPDTAPAPVRESLTRFRSLLSHTDAPLTSFFSSHQIDSILNDHRFHIVDDLTWDDLRPRYSPTHPGGHDPLGRHLIHAQRRQAQSREQTRPRLAT